MEYGAPLVPMNNVASGAKFEEEPRRPKGVVDRIKPGRNSHIITSVNGCSVSKMLGFYLVNHKKLVTQAATQCQITGEAGATTEA